MKQKTARNNYLVDLHDRGITFQSLGMFFGFSKQRAHQIYHQTHQNKRRASFMDKVRDCIGRWINRVR